jgi:predicted GNAT superfamily acetyltransferase
MGGSEGTSVIDIRTLRTHAEFEDAVRLQQQIWGFSDIELLPVRLFVVASKIGGQALGAFEDGRMIGFCLAIPGLKANGLSYLHSHMLGVLPEYTNRGVGRMLKLEQRNDAMLRGVELIEWTFDPLELKNAYFNIERLGAVVRRFVLNQYGTTTSALHTGMPTDRCVAEWWISSLYVEALLSGQRPPLPEVEDRITVPEAIQKLRRDDPKQAREVQKSVSEQFLHSFERGLAVVGFERTEKEGIYLLGQWTLE